MKSTVYKGYKVQIKYNNLKIKKEKDKEEKSERKNYNNS